MADAVREEDRLRAALDERLGVPTQEPEFDEPSAMTSAAVRWTSLNSVPAVQRSVAARPASRTTAWSSACWS
jgi:hypothetical protein